MPQTLPTAAIAALVLAMTVTAGCIAGSDAALPDAQTPTSEQPQRLEPTSVTYEGTIRAQACYQGGVDTCNRALLKSEDHVRWFEVDLPAPPLAGELQVTWDAREFPETGVYLRLECWDRSVPRCSGGGPDLARADGTEAPLSISVDDLSFLEPATTLYVAFGVPARDTPVGEYHPAADLDFTITGVFLVPSGAS